MSENIEDTIRENPHFGLVKPQIKNTFQIQSPIKDSQLLNKGMQPKVSLGP
jgi:hypothetical protein